MNIKRLTYFILFILLFPFLIAAKNAAAQQTSTSSADQATQQAIENLKNKIASQVASMNLEEKRGIIGFVSSVSDNQLSVTDIGGNTRYIDVDELTKFSDPNNSSFGLSDLSDGKKISVVGLYNKETKRILARFIDTQSDPEFLTGEILSLDHVNIQLVMTMENNKQQKVDIQDSTQIAQYTKDSGVVHFGFSKMNTGDRILIVGYPNKTDKTLLEADRVIDLTDLPKDPGITLSQPTASVSAAVSPGP